MWKCRPKIILRKVLNKNIYNFHNLIPENKRSIRNCDVKWIDYKKCIGKRKKKKEEKSLKIFGKKSKSKNKNIKLGLIFRSKSSISGVSELFWKLIFYQI